MVGSHSLRERGHTLAAPSAKLSLQREYGEAGRRRVSAHSRYTHCRFQQRSPRAYGEAGEARVSELSWNDLWVLGTSRSRSAKETRGPRQTGEARRRFPSGCKGRRASQQAWWQNKKPARVARRAEARVSELSWNHLKDLWHDQIAIGQRDGAPETNGRGPAPLSIRSRSTQSASASRVANKKPARIARRATQTNAPRDPRRRRSPRSRCTL